MDTETSTPEPTPDYRVELFVRSFAPTGAHEQQQAIVDRLVELAAENRIGTISSTVWGDRICPGTASKLTTGQSILDDIDRFREWAQRHGASLEPFFEEHEVRSMFEDAHTVIVPPVLCLAVSDGDELWGVFPCVSRGEVCSVMDGLTFLDDSRGTPTAPFTGRASVQQ